MAQRGNSPAATFLTPATRSPTFVPPRGAAPDLSRALLPHLFHIARTSSAERWADQSSGIRRFSMLDTRVGVIARRLVRSRPCRPRRNWAGTLQTLWLAGR